MSSKDAPIEPAQGVYEIDRDSRTRLLNVLAQLESTVRELPQRVATMRVPLYAIVLMALMTICSAIAAVGAGIAAWSVTHGHDHTGDWATASAQIEHACDR